MPSACQFLTLSWTHSPSLNSLSAFAEPSTPEKSKILTALCSSLES